MKIFKSILNFLGDIGRNRAARHLARRGDHEGARRVRMSEFRGWI